MTGNDATLTSSSKEETMDFGGPLLVSALIFLIISCFCVQTCIFFYMNYPSWFTIGTSSKKDDDVIVVVAAAAIREQDDEHEEEEDVSAAIGTRRPKLTKLSSMTMMMESRGIMTSTRTTASTSVSMTEEEEEEDHDELHHHGSREIEYGRS